MKSNDYIERQALDFPERDFRRAQRIKRIFVTGATGQVGSAVRDASRATEKWSGDARVRPVAFDFIDPVRQDAALADCDSLFLLRSPQLTGDFGEFIARARHHGVSHIVFLSVQGVPRNRFTPHHKIEQRLGSCGVPCTLLRPAYFMQNFTSMLHDELVRRHCIFLPAGNARFTLVDVDDLTNAA